MFKAQPFTLNGVAYPSRSAAARAYGCGVDVLRWHERRGTLHLLGTGHKPTEPMPVEIRGVVYPDAKAAAAAHGVTKMAIYRAIATGKTDHVGLGLSKPKGLPAVNAQPIVIGPRRFASLHAVSAFLGRGRNYAANLLRSGQRERLVGEVMARVIGFQVADSDRVGSAPQAVTLCGVRFDSMNAADVHFGLTHGTVSKAQARGGLQRLEARLIARMAKGARHAA